MPVPHIATIASRPDASAATLHGLCLEAIPKAPNLGAGALVQRRLSATPQPLRHASAFVRQRGG